MYLLAYKYAERYRVCRTLCSHTQANDRDQSGGSGKPTEGKNMELYIHIPFCRQKCNYCSFASFTGQEAYFQKYVSLLLKESRIRKNDAAEPFTTVYIGGGTPSLFPPILLSKMIRGIREVWDLDTVQEFTIEANPGTVTKEWIDTALSLGINRLSLGMQAYQERLLYLLGRIHRFEDVVTSVSAARSSGFGNISIDLIFGIPTQTMEEWSQTVKSVISLHPEHISAYGLIPEEGTPLYRDLEKGLLALPDPDDERQMYDLAIRKTAEAGYKQYEISNFSIASYECRHNIGYWTQVPYIGLGVSAASMTGVRCCSEGTEYERSVNPNTMIEYEKMINEGMKSPSETISSSEARFETMMLGLRMNRGVSERFFQTMHHISIESCYGKKLKEMENHGLMLLENGSWKLTARGFDIQNSILVELMDD